MLQRCCCEKKTSLSFTLACIINSNEKSGFMMPGIMAEPTVCRMIDLKGSCLSSVWSESLWSEE